MPFWIKCEFSCTQPRVGFSACWAIQHFEYGTMLWPWRPGLGAKICAGPQTVVKLPLIVKLNCRD